MPDFSYISDNLAAIRSRLSAAAERKGHKLPRLIAVTKSASDEEVEALLSLGIDAIAENRPQMFAAREEILLRARGERAAHGKPPLATEIHLIGHLQTNKAKLVVGRAACIQSLDSMRLAEEIEKQAAAKGILQPVLIEINSGCEPQKGGILPGEAEAFAEALTGLSHLRVMGLMTIGPVLESTEEYRPYFRATRLLAEGLAARGLLPEQPTLSMGMSDSFEVAAEEGATEVRVGRSLFVKAANDA